MLIIGIAGGTGSGKTTLTRTLYNEFAPHVTVLTHDNYYKSHDNLTYEERCDLNYDEPAAFDNELFINHLNELKAGNSVECPVYDYTVHNRSDKTIHIEPNCVIIVEGIMIFSDPDVASVFDTKIFVDTDSDTRLIRRIRRDVTERNRTLESVLSQYENTVKPMHDKYVQPSRNVADIVILDGAKNIAVLDVLKARIQHEIINM